MQLTVKGEMTGSQKIVESRPRISGMDDITKETNEKAAQAPSSFSSDRGRKCMSMRVLVERGGGQGKKRGN